MSEGGAGVSIYQKEWKQEKSASQDATPNVHLAVSSTKSHKIYTAHLSFVTDNSAGNKAPPDARISAARVVLQFLALGCAVTDAFGEALRVRQGFDGSQGLRVAFEKNAVARVA